ncbi:ATP-binding protein [Streptomyces sp. CB02959]|uniref:AAA family ATPase n=1 Tax=Streptomyces sp. CB02959 TaxID=2020330 RepID=UPI000C280E3A|nr:AAA family ATPase [Streptomyces sp. CB02959]PJN40320.1 ATP-binding protein [Streptomyces sp. CB02959]
MSSAPSDPGRLAHSRLREEFGARLRRELRTAEPAPEAVPDARRAYREAACLLASFDPRRLRLPGEDRPTGGAVLALLDDCTTLGVRDHARWALKPEVREAALRGMAGPEAARRALEANREQFPAEPGGPEALCLAYLQGNLPPTADRPARWSADELADTLQAVLWLSRLPGVSGLPDPAELQAALERARLLAPLRRLVASPFQGRSEELRRLRAYVDVSGTDAGTAPADRPRGADSGAAFVPPLVVHGPGGMGKSTLLAKFLLEHVAGPAGGPPGGGPGAFPFPFAYIDFERPTLSIQEPVTMIAEAARQLGVQYPAFRAELDALADECQQAAATQREEQERCAQLHRLATTRVLGRSSSQEFQLLATERETGLVRRVADVLLRAVAASGQHDPPFVLAVDSFEAAQYRGSPVLGRMWAICTSLQGGYPRFRMLVSGRAPVDHPARSVALGEIELRELERPAAIALLRSLGVDDPDVATALAERVGGHPLSLRLAARAATLAGGESERTGDLIRSLPERHQEVFHRVDQMLVQGILYDRILSHIANEDVRRLAYPGLALRVITPEIIREVLAGPCGLPVATEEAAHRLFAELSRLDMVEPAGPAAVRYRGDVRAIMLRLPGGDRTEVMREVERRAVAHYAARDGVEARAEEIYHRLRLDEDPRSVEERWLPGVERFLAGAQQDMSARAAGLLTARLGGGAPERVAAGADQEDWERIAAREAEDLLAQGFADAALARLGQRRPWTPCSPLHSLMADALNRLGRRDEARRAVADAVGQAERAGCAERRLELLLLAARLAEEAGDLADADRRLRVAEDVAVGLGQDLEAMGARLARARLPAGTGDTARSGVQAGHQLATQLRELPDRVLADQPALVRAVASQIYGQDPGALTHALDVVGLPTDDGTLDTLGAAMCRATRRQPALLGSVMEILDDAAGPSGPPPWAGPAAHPAPAPTPPCPPPPRPDPGTAAGAGAGTEAGAAAPARPAPEPASHPTGIAGILRLARDRGTLDALARRLLSVPDRSGELVSGVAAAMGVGTRGRTTPQEVAAPRAGRHRPDEGSGPAGPDHR